MKTTKFDAVFPVLTFLNAVQFLVWAAASLLGVFSYHCVFFMPPSYAYNGAIVASIVKFYFQGVACPVPDHAPGYENVSSTHLMTPDEVHSWTMSYLVASFIQFIMWSYLFYGQCKNKITLKYLVRISSILGLLVAVMDLSLAGIFLRDHFRLKDYEEKRNLRDELSSVPLMLSVVTARGIALWLFNLLVALYFFVWSLSEKSSPVAIDPKPVTAYDNCSFVATEPLPWPQRELQIQTPTESERSLESSTDSHEAVTSFNEESPSPEPVRKDFGRPPAVPKNFQRPPAVPNDFQRPPAVPNDFQRPPAVPNDFQRPPAVPKDFQHPPAWETKPEPCKCNCCQMGARRTEEEVLPARLSPSPRRSYVRLHYPELKDELEEKLKTIRLKQYLQRNFNQGGTSSSGRVPQSLWSPEPESSPRAFTKSNNY